MKKEIEEIVIELLREKKWKITTAESCTGGLLAGRLLNVSGASEVYEEGHITYANAAKEKILGVSHKTLETFGAVSVQTAEEMARGAAKIANAQVALVTTGVAGPTGGTKEKPVGLVYIGCFFNGRLRVEECHFYGTRDKIRNASVKRAIELLKEELEEEKPSIQGNIHHVGTEEKNAD